MYTKTRSTLAGLTAASLFVLSIWLFGHPITSVAPTHPASMVQMAIAADSQAASRDLDGRSLPRMNMAMPYFSFALLRTRKGIN
jgi:hypothetical protein